jgi:hypothetical protein
MSALAAVQIDEHSEAWTRLEKSPQWAALTPSQKIWIVVRLATGSALDATLAGYKAKSEANARVLSYELAKNPSIVAALNVAMGKTPAPATVKNERARLVREVRKQLRAAEEGSVAASRLSAQLERLILPAQEITSYPVPSTDSQLNAKASSPSQVPADALEVFSDPVSGVAIGFRAANGEVVKL